MTLEQLKQMLEAGKITQEVFDDLAKGLEQPENNNENKSGEKSDPDDKDEKDEQLEKKIQSIVDRATNKLGNENKTLREQLEKMKKEKMTEDERKQYEINEKEQEIKARELELKAKENRLYAIKALKKAGLDDGSETAMDLVDFVVAEDETAIDTKVKAFDGLVKKLVQEQVDKKFKENGGKPPKSGGDGANGDNPYSEKGFNLTKQMELELNNPELAKTLRQQAGEMKK